MADKEKFIPPAPRPMVAFERKYSAFSVTSFRNKIQGATYLNRFYFHFPDKTDVLNYIYGASPNKEIEKLFEDIFFYASNVTVPGRGFQMNSEFHYPNGFRVQTPNAMRYGDGNITMNFYVDAKYLMYKFFNDWMNKIQNQRTGFLDFYNSYTTNLHVYQIPTEGFDPLGYSNSIDGIESTILKNDFLKDRHFQFELVRCFPAEIRAIEFKHDSADRVQIEVQMKYSGVIFEPERVKEEIQKLKSPKGRGGETAITGPMPKSAPVDDATADYLSQLDGYGMGPPANLMDRTGITSFGQDPLSVYGTEGYYDSNPTMDVRPELSEMADGALYALAGDMENIPGYESLVNESLTEEQRRDLMLAISAREIVHGIRDHITVLDALDNPQASPPPILLPEPVLDEEGNVTNFGEIMSRYGTIMNPTGWSSNLDVTNQPYPDVSRGYDFYLDQVTFGGEDDDRPIQLGNKIGSQFATTVIKNLDSPEREDTHIPVTPVTDETKDPIGNLGTTPEGRLFLKNQVVDAERRIVQNYDRINELFDERQFLLDQNDELDVKIDGINESSVRDENGGLNLNSLGEVTKLEQQKMINRDTVTRMEANIVELQKNNTGEVLFINSSLDSINNPVNNLTDDEINNGDTNTVYYDGSKFTTRNPAITLDPNPVEFESEPDSDFYPSLWDYNKPPPTQEEIDSYFINHGLRYGNRTREDPLQPGEELFFWVGGSTPVPAEESLDGVVRPDALFLLQENYRIARAHINMAAIRVQNRQAVETEKQREKQREIDEINKFD